MFDYLKNENFQNVAPAIHHSIQLIRQWAIATSLDDYFAFKGDDSLSAEQIDLIKRIISEIELREQTSIKNLDPNKKRPYIIQLTDNLQILSNDQFHVDKDKGRQSLQQLRDLGF